MDPQACLEEQIRLANQIHHDIDAGLEPDDIDAERLAELVLALDTWILNGGALPKHWQLSRRRP